jgi:ABC-type glycerol-3-phosphate transport system substrate-binding protein
MFRTLSSLLSGLLLLGVTACRPASENTPTLLRVWCHQGQEAENLAMRAIADAFNAAHADQYIRVRLDFFPDYQYTEKLSIAAAAGDLPDAFDLDGPTVAQFVDAGLLAPLDAHLTDADRADFLPTILAQGIIEGQVYALGAYDSAMVLYYDRVLLAEAGVTPPPEGQGWTWDAFVTACQQLKQAGHDPVALHMDVTADEWYTYAFSPILWSAGGDLIDTQLRRTRGVLDAPANVRAVTAWQHLFTAGLAARNPIQPDPFGAGLTAMDWNGHWMARSHLAAKGDRLGVMPLPHLGQPVAPCGSWAWAIAADTPHRDAAALWLKWVTDPARGIQPIVAAGGAVPARRSAFAFFPEYEQDPFRLFRAQLEQYGRPRPKTPHYPILTQQFAAALRDIANGAAVEPRLRRAADAVQRILDRHAPHQPHPERSP